MKRGELKQVGIDMYHGSVFHTAMIRRVDEVPLVFVVLRFLTQEQLEKEAKDGVVAYYEYINKALPRSINGMPMFVSCRKLNKDQNNVVLEAYRQEKERCEELSKDDEDV